MCACVRLARWGSVGVHEGNSAQQKTVQGASLDCVNEYILRVIEKCTKSVLLSMRLDQVLGSHTCCKMAIFAMILKQ